MPGELDSIEAILLDELTLIVETIRLNDLRIRESVEGCLWEQGCYLTARLVDWLQEKHIYYEALGEKLAQSGCVDATQVVQQQRCSDMSTYMLTALSRYVPLYQRILAGFIEKLEARAASSLEVTDAIQEGLK
jgi:hypothetical protein